MTNVIKVAFIRDNQPHGREYTYYTPVPVEIGDRVDIDGMDGISQAIVTQVNVPESEILRFGERAKSIIGKTALPSCKGVVLTPEGAVSVQDFAEPLHKTVGKAIGGLMQIVYPGGLAEPFCMIVNEEGRLKNLPFNPIASFWYGTQVHGSPIVGTVVLMKTALNEEDEPDLTGLSDAEIAALERLIAVSKNAHLPEEPKSPPPPAQVIEIPPDVDVGEFFAGLFGIGRKTAVQ